MFNKLFLVSVHRKKNLLTNPKLLNKSIELREETVAQYPWCILAVPHSSYDLAWLKENCRSLVDLPNALRNAK